MSASLVGSEMCIRDRDIGLARRARPKSVCSDKSAMTPTPVPPSCDVVPVSYTHLTLPTICSV
eukprot:11087648-Alexandrium_andersonii.AAC.1